MIDSKLFAENLQQAREAAILGNYESSDVYYQGVVQQVSRHVPTVVNMDEKRGWMKAQKEIVSEFEQLKSIQGVLDSLGRNEPRPVAQQVNYEEPTRDDPDVWPAPPERKPVARAPPPKPVAKQPAKATPARQPRPEQPRRPNNPRDEKPVKARDARKGKEKGEDYGDVDQGAAKKFEAVGQEAELAEALERDIVIRDIDVTWESIAGLEDAKRLLREAVIWPILRPDMFVGIRSPWKGILMVGPPGTGKTMLAKAVASRAQTTFFNVSLSTMASKWRGESQKLMHLLFEMARFYAPSTIFIDEIDSIASQRGSDGEGEASRQVKVQLLTEMDGLNSVQPDGGMVMVLGATNFPWDLDEALLRRLQKRIYIPLPDKEALKRLLEVNLKGITLAEEVELESVVEALEGYSGADVTSLCQDVAMMPFRRKTAGLSDDELRNMSAELPPCCQADFEEAISKVKKSVGAKNLKKYEDWMAEFGAT